MLDDIIIKPLTVEQLVAQDSTVKGVFHFNRGVWWRKIRFFFYQPAFFFQTLDRESSSPLLHKALLGYHYVVSRPEEANSCFRMLVYKNIKSYSFNNLSSNARHRLRTCIKSLEVNVISNLNELITDGYDTYMSFRQRTNWGKDRSNHDGFSQWISRAFALPGRLFLGAYFHGKLIAFTANRAVEHMASVNMIICHTDYMNLMPNYLLIHTFLNICSNSPGITSVECSSVSLKPSLDDFKKRCGFEVISYPTYAWINPLFKPAVKVLYPSKLRQLYGPGGMRHQ